MKSKSTTRRRPASLVALLIAVLLGLLFIATGVAAAAQAGGTVPENKVDVCKYVGSPGVDESLQTGQNPIEVSVNSIKDAPHDPPQVGDYFADAQGRSLVVAVAGEPQATILDCPGYVVPTPSDTPTTSEPPTSEPPTTSQPPTTEPPTTSDAPSTSVAPSTSEVPSTSSEPPTTLPPTTSVTPSTTTVVVPSSSEAPSTSSQVPSTPVSTVTTTKTKTSTTTTVVLPKPTPKGVAPPRRLSSTGISAGTQILLGIALLLLGAILAFGPALKRRPHQH